MAPRYHVYLDYLDNPVVLIPAATGVVYHNQVNGVATAHRELEGFVVPLPRLNSPVFEPDWWERNHNYRVTGDDAAWAQVRRDIEAALANEKLPDSPIRDIRVSGDSADVEAWVAISFSFEDCGEDGGGSAIVPLTGILTWQNCD